MLNKLMMLPCSPTQRSQEKFLKQTLEIANMTLMNTPEDYQAANKHFPFGFSQGSRPGQNIPPFMRLVKRRF
jgi:hypothetical protein